MLGEKKKKGRKDLGESQETDMRKYELYSACWLFSKYSLCQNLKGFLVLYWRGHKFFANSVSQSISFERKVIYSV